MQEIGKPVLEHPLFMIISVYDNLMSSNEVMLWFSQKVKLCRAEAMSKLLWIF